MTFFSEFIQPILKSPWAWLLLPALFVIFIFKLNYKALSSHKEKPESFDTAIQWLKEDNFGQFYRFLLGTLLDKVSFWLGDSAQCRPHLIYQPSQNYKLTPHNRFFSINPFTHQSYEFLLRLAFVYPILIFLIFWAMNGTASISGYNVFNLEAFKLAEEIRWQLVLFGFIAPFIFILILLRFSLLKQWLILVGLSGFAFFSFKEELIAFWTAFLILFLSSYISGWLSMWLIKRDRVIAHNAIYRFSLVCAAAVGGVVGAAGVAGAGAVAGAAVAGAVGAVAAGAVGGGVDVAVAVVVAAVVAAVVAVVFVSIERLKEKSINAQRSFIYWSSFTFLMLLLVWIAFFMNKGSDKLQFLLLFYLVFPLLNAPLDWLSLGITRGLLHSIKHEHHGGWQAFLWAIFDLILAIFFLLAVSGLLVLVVGFSDQITGLEVLKNGLYEIDKTETAENYYWVYAMLLTTLIPTLAHFALAGASLTLWLPHSWRHRIANNLEHNHYKLWAASIYLTITPIIGILAPVILLYGLYKLVTAHGNWLGNMLLEWAKMVALLVT